DPDEEQVAAVLAALPTLAGQALFGKAQLRLHRQHRADRQLLLQRPHQFQELVEAMLQIRERRRQKQVDRLRRRQPALGPAIDIGPQDNAALGDLELLQVALDFAGEVEVALEKRRAPGPAAERLQANDTGAG